VQAGDRVEPEKSTQVREPGIKTAPQTALERLLDPSREPSLPQDPSKAIVQPIPTSTATRRALTLLAHSKRRLRAARVASTLRRCPGGNRAADNRADRNGDPKI
jgi:hypothetical protein